MKEIIRKWFANPGMISPEEAAEIICEYCRLFGDRTVNGEELKALFYIHSCGIPIQFEKLIKYICIKNNYNVRELWSAPDEKGNRKIIYRILDD